MAFCTFGYASAMVRRFLARLYRSLPVIRELTQIRDAVRHEVSTLKAAHVMCALDVELARHPRYSDPLRLARYAFQVCSQSGEDGMLHEIFKRVGMSSRTFVEIGVGDGAENNTAFLLALGWSGYWIDGQDDFRRTLESRRIASDQVRGLVSIVRKDNAATLLRQLGVPAEFDLLSLDVDQNTYYVWQGLQGYRPRVVVIEYNAALPPDVDWKVAYDPQRAWDGTQNFGASLKALERLGRELGYSLVGCDLAGINAFFVRDDLTASRFAEPFTAENHYEPPRYALLHRQGHRPGILDPAAGSR